MSKKHKPRRAMRRVKHSAAVRKAAENDAVMFLLTALMQPRFGTKVTQWRTTLGKTYSQVAREAKIARSTWERVEMGDDVRLSVVVKILAWSINNNADISMDPVTEETPATAFKIPGGPVGTPDPFPSDMGIVGPEV